MIAASAVRRARVWFELPLAAWVGVLTAFPLAWSLALAFARMPPEGGVEFAGFANFARLARDYRFWNGLSVTLSFAALATAVELALGTALAVVLFERAGPGGLAPRWQALVAIPLFTAPVALGYLGLTVFHEESGPLNSGLRAAGLPAPPWLSDGRWAFASLLLVDVWEWTPFCFLIAYAGLLAVPADLFEAARLEPLGAFGRARHLLLPMLRPTLALAGLLRFVEALKTADLPFSLTGGGPAIATETLALYAYRRSLRFSDFGYGSALAWVLFGLVLVVCQLLARRSLRRASA